MVDAMYVKDIYRNETAQFAREDSISITSLCTATT